MIRQMTFKSIILCRKDSEAILIRTTYFPRTNRACILGVVAIPKVAVPLFLDGEHALTVHIGAPKGLRPPTHNFRHSIRFAL